MASLQHKKQEPDAGVRRHDDHPIDDFLAHLQVERLDEHAPLFAPEGVEALDELLERGGRHAAFRVGARKAG